MLSDMNFTQNSMRVGQIFLKVLLVRERERERERRNRNLPDSKHGPS
jgi:hypothetical protein